jgi:aminoglycoside 6-adenylyltransferase
VPFIDKNREEQVVIEGLVCWAEGQPSVRAMILTGSRAVPNAATDIFSDYDVILVLSDIQPYYQGRAWLEYFGSVLALYRDPLESENGCSKSGYVVQYDDGLKIDFTLWPVEILERVITTPDLPAEFDAGYTILYDPEHLTEALKPPSFRGYIPTPPSEEEYQAAIEVFFLDTTYVAKYLRRDDLVAAKYILDNIMKQEQLLPMLTWQMEIEQGWSVKPGPYGRSIKRWLRSDLMKRLESTYTGSGLDANWQALFQSIALFRIAALDVSTLMGYTYPQEPEQRVVAYLNRVKKLRMESD